MSRTYSLPQIYDIAFDFRDVPGEVDFLLNGFRKHTGREAGSALELACGPGYHVREMARRSIVSDGLDLEPAMVDYTRGLITGEGLKADIFEGDMRTYRSAKKYDLVYSLLASFAHLTTNQDILDNFECAASMLNDGGLYIISTAHPRDFYGEEESALKTFWEMERDGIKVVTDWGGSGQALDPLTECDDVVISFTVTQDGRTMQYEFPERLRRCSMQTFLALVRLSGQFEIVDLLGDFDLDCKLTNSPDASRLVAVLEKQSG
jgi:SAM-dependent methyltransferase